MLPVVTVCADAVADAISRQRRIGRLRKAFALHLIA
jgi:hypothetical protein